MYMHVNNGKGEFFACYADSTHDGWRQAIAARPHFFEGGSCYFDISAARTGSAGFNRYTPESKGIFVPKPPYVRSMRDRRN